jgi:hypothetical protein
MPNPVFAIGIGWVEVSSHPLVRSTQPKPESVIIELGTKNFVWEPNFLFSKYNRKSFSILIPNLSLILY